MKRRKPGRLKRTISRLLEKSGLEIDVDLLNKRIAVFVIASLLLATLVLVSLVVIRKDTTYSYVLVYTGMMWTLGFALLMLVYWLFFLFYVDLRTYRRRIAAEEVLSDFLQLTSANIRAGMPIDQALWQAIRPNFGVLAKEMEEAARKTMSGTSLEDALREFSHKYDSMLLKRSMSLLIEGLNAGGEIGELLDRIATNIQESRIMQREMSASVTTYVIFIDIAAMMASPFLLALAHQLLIVIDSIILNVDVPETTSGFAISFSQVGASPDDFRIFAIVVMVLTSFLSACVVSTIKKGDIKSGLRFIPIFIVTTLIIFFIMDVFFGSLVSGLL